MVTSTHKELLPLIFTIVEEDASTSQNSEGPESITSAIAAAAAAVSGSSSSTSGAHTSYRNVLPSDTSVSSAARKVDSFSAPLPQHYRGRYTTKFTYKDWLNAHKSLSVNEITVPDGSQLTDKKSKEKQKEAEDLLKAINAYLEVLAMSHFITYIYLISLGCCRSSLSS